MMEAAGIEPASENVPQESLHTCQVPICFVPRPKGTCKPDRGTSPLSFAPRRRASRLRLSCKK